MSPLQTTGQDRGTGAGLIERLRNAYAAWNDSCDGVPEDGGVALEAVDCIAELEAERDRLRGLLKDAEAVLDPDTDMALVIEIREALKEARQ